MTQQKTPAALSHIGLIFVFALIAMLPAYFYGVPSGNDQIQHYHFAWTVDNALRNGNLYPGYGEHTNHEYGDVGLRFYPPLTSYLLVGANFVTRDWFFASLAAFTLVFFIGGLGVYSWLRDGSGTTTALVAAGLYTFAPYHLNEIYNNFLLAEFVATAVAPWCFLYSSRVVSRRGWRPVIGLSVAASLLVLTHLPLTILCAVALAIYAAVLMKRDTAVSSLFRLASAGLLAALMTAFYWARWIPEISWVKHSSPKYFSTTWDYQTNFLLRPAHFTDFGSDALNLWFADVLLAAGLFIVVPAIVLLFTKRLDWNRPLIAAGVTLAAAVLLATPITGAVWDNVAPLQMVQFPWRWLAVISLFAAYLGAAGIVGTAELLKAAPNALATAGLAIVLALFVFVAAFVTRGGAFIDRPALNSQMKAVPETEACDCWWPIWAERNAFDQSAAVVAGDRAVDVIEWSNGIRRFNVASGAPTTASLNTFYYPRWQATVNGDPGGVGPDPSGRIALTIPPENSTVIVEFKEPKYVPYLSVLSLIAWAGVLGTMIFLRARPLL